MIMKVFSVWDLKTEAYMQPFFSPMIGSGIRAFTDAAADPGSMLSKHPADFQLQHIGEFNDATGVLTSCNPVALGSAADYENFEHPEDINKRGAAR